MIRVGSCGAITDDLQLRDVIAASSSCTDSAMNRVRFDGLIDFAPVADFGLLRNAVDAAAERGISMRVGPVLAADAFYTDRPDLFDKLAMYGVLAVEMESAALYTIAARFRARALTILTVSDHIKTGAQTTSEEREQTFGQMVEIALSRDHQRPDPLAVRLEERSHHRRALLGEHAAVHLGTVVEPAVPYDVPQ